MLDRYHLLKRFSKFENATLYAKNHCIYISHIHVQPLMQKFNIVHAKLSLMHVAVLILIISQFVATYSILIIFA